MRFTKHDITIYGYNPLLEFQIQNSSSWPYQLLYAAKEPRIPFQFESYQLSRICFDSEHLSTLFYLENRGYEKELIKSIKLQY